MATPALIRPPAPPPLPSLGGGGLRRPRAETDQDPDERESLELVEYEQPSLLRPSLSPAAAPRPASPIGDGRVERFGLALRVEQWAAAERHARDEDGIISRYAALWGAVSLGLLTEEEVADAIAVSEDLPRFQAQDIPHTGILAHALELAEFDRLRLAQLLPYDFDDEQRVRIVVVDPTTVSAEAVLADLASHPRALSIGTRSDVVRIFSDLGKRQGPPVDMLQAAGELQLTRTRLADREDRATDSQIVKLVDSYLRQAVSLHASDLHFDPIADGLRIRARVDGRLRDLARIDAKAIGGDAHQAKEMARAVLSQIISVRARLPIDKVQYESLDGRFRFESGDVASDVRVSAVGVGGTGADASLVLRLLGTANTEGRLSNLGLEPKLVDMLRYALLAKMGVVACTGPTGSGKSTTLTAMINEIMSPEKNIITIEDPVERVIPGARQLEVRKEDETKMTFARLLASALRQDPDIIMVGEVRDTETAETAMRAANTGHLLLTTMHNNTALEGITRLEDLGVSRFTVASTTLLLWSQRLIGQLCSHCKTKGDATDRAGVSDLLASARYGPKITFGEIGLDDRDLADAHSSLPRSRQIGDYAHAATADMPVLEYPGLRFARRCTHCANLGQKGRLVVSSAIEFTPAVRHGIEAAVRRQELQELAYAQGSRTLFASAICRVVRGEVSLESAIRELGPGFTKYSL